MTRRMVRRGARHIVLLSRSGRFTDELKLLAKESRRLGASIYVMACDVAEESHVKHLIEELRDGFPPIKGVIHAAMVLRVGVPDLTHQLPYANDSRMFYLRR